MTRSYRDNPRRHRRKAKPRRRDLKAYDVPKGTEAMEFWQAHRGCLDKTRFYSAKLARKAAEERGLRPYRCTFCGKWHLTSQGTPPRGTLPGADLTNSDGSAPGRDSRNGEEDET